MTATAFVSSERSQIFDPISDSIRPILDTRFYRPIAAPLNFHPSTWHEICILTALGT